MVSYVYFPLFIGYMLLGLQTAKAVSLDVSSLAGPTSLDIMRQELSAERLIVVTASLRHGSDAYIQAG